MTVQNHTSYSSLHAFLTAVISFLKKEQQFADKNIQNTMFVALQTTAPLSHISDPHDFTDAIHALYDLILKVLHFRNQDDDKKLTDFVSSLVSCISRSKHISSDEAIDDIVSFAVQTFFKNISTDGIPDLDPRGALLLLKLGGVLSATFKFSGPVGRGKVSNYTTFDSGNTWLYLEIHDRSVLTYENIATATQKLSTQTLNLTNLQLWQDRAKLSSKFVVDHHHRYCQSTSITRMIYVLLIALKKLSPTDTTLQRFVHFIDMSDDMYYQLATMDDRISLGSLLGIQRELLYKKLIDIDDIYALFVQDSSFSGLEPLSDQQLDFVSHGQLSLCKNAIKNKADELQSGTIKFLTLKDTHTFYHHKTPFLWLISDTIPRVLDVTTKHGYGLLQLNQKAGEIKLHNVTGFDEEFLASLTHPAIKVMKGRNIFIKANEEISDDVIQSCLISLGCPIAIVSKMIATRIEILKNKRF